MPSGEFFRGCVQRDCCLTFASFAYFCSKVLFWGQRPPEVSTEPQPLSVTMGRARSMGFRLGAEGRDQDKTEEI